MGFEGEWEKFVERLARDLAPALRRRLYTAQLERLRGLGPPADKLVYLYLVVAEPQPFVGVWRGLGVGVKTVDRALRRLREGMSFRMENICTGSRDWDDGGIPCLCEKFFLLS